MRQPEDESAAIVPDESWQLCDGPPQFQDMIDNVVVWFIPASFQKVIIGVLLRQSPEAQIRSNLGTRFIVQAVQEEV